MTTGLVWDEQYFWFDAGMVTGPFIEPHLAADTPESKRRIKNLLDASGMIDYLTSIKPIQIERGDLLRVHTDEYIDLVKELSEANGGESGQLAWVGQGGYPIARLAVGGCYSAMDAVVRGVVDNAYALVRPCGHHALPSKGMGAAIFCNIAISIMKLRDLHDIGRIAVVDWDVHHGNGTEAAFYSDSNTLTISIHQDNCYPKGTGQAENRGEGDGYGYNINIPLPPGSGHGAYLHTIDQIVVPALEKFKPELIIIASGIDAAGFDTNARMMCYSDTFRSMTQAMMNIANDVCEGKLVLCHEGGYSEVHTPFATLAIFEALTQQDSGVPFIYDDFIASYGGQNLQPHQAEVIRRIAEATLKEL